MVKSAKDPAKTDGLRRFPPLTQESRSGHTHVVRCRKHERYSKQFADLEAASADADADPAEPEADPAAPADCDAEAEAEAEAETPADADADPAEPAADPAAPEADAAVVEPAESEQTSTFSSPVHGIVGFILQIDQRPAAFGPLQPDSISPLLEELVVSGFSL